MGNMLQNQAAWIVASKTSPLRVSHAPYNSPGPDEIVVRSHAVAINPVDWKQQDLDLMIPSYPSIFGCDVAGVVEEVGSSVTRFKKGDRVISNAECLIKGKDYAAFQLYVKTPANVTCLLPSDMTTEQGCVLPLAVNTAGHGLFGEGYLKLPRPSLNPEETDKAVFIYGGSTSVGSCAIQLAKAAGVHVVTTASRRNHERCRALGANSVFDYGESNWIDQVVDHLQGREVLGAFDTVAHGDTTKLCTELLSRLNVTAATISTNPPPDGVKSEVVFGANVTLDKKLAQAIWADYLERALAQGRFSAEPRPHVVGHGLDKIQEGMDMQKKGVSAVKLVVRLD